MPSISPLNPAWRNARHITKTSRRCCLPRCTASWIVLMKNARTYFFPSSFSFQTAPHSATRRWCSNRTTTKVRGNLHCCKSSTCPFLTSNQAVSRTNAEEGRHRDMRADTLRATAWRQHAGQRLCSRASWRR